MEKAVAYGIKSDEKPFFCQIYAIIWGKMVHVVIDRYFSLFLKGFLKIFLNPRLSLIKWRRYASDIFKLQTRDLSVAHHCTGKTIVSFGDKVVKMWVLRWKFLKTRVSLVKLRLSSKMMDTFSNSGEFGVFGWKISENFVLWGEEGGGSLGESTRPQKTQTRKQEGDRKTFIFHNALALFWMSISCL